KESDTPDGWFDSGSTHIASLRLDNKENWPSDIYLEGADQYRGWFQSSLLTSVGALGEGAPFKKCLTHGWVVDGEGRAMHKSLGNGVDPAELVRDFGADIVRLWAASADYRVDVRCSKEIFKQLAQTYLKFRNTARYCLGNLDGFDAEKLVQPEEMLELDRWAVTKLNALIDTAFRAYDNYEFHILTHAINDFCVVELSSFYLDILKDRLYCEEKNGLKRRSAQTALYLILDALARMYAPILPYTCDEIWQAMPHKAEDDVRNIVLNDMVQPYTAYALDEAAMAKWDTLIALRSDVNGVLEAARADKKIGKALEAQVNLKASDEAAAQALEAVAALDLAELFIVSAVTTGDMEGEALAQGTGTNYAGLTIQVYAAPGEKCPRCWMHSTKADENGLCPRCSAVMANFTFED
ncbi:MAG: class I tRNA ligase family protein, partial [Oscillospiraceae bacterium]|nr:class I tRNA ligase family protein [Oscillospiraceae bacterium]